MIHVCGNSKQTRGWPENQGAVDNLVVQWLNFLFPCRLDCLAHRNSFDSFSEEF